MPDAGHEHDRRVGAAHRAASRARRFRRSTGGSPRGMRRAARAAARPAPRARRRPAGRAAAAAPSCAGSGRGRTSRALPAAAPPPRRGSRARPRSRRSARSPAGRDPRGHGSWARAARRARRRSSTGQRGERLTPRAERVGPAVLGEVTLGVLDQGQRERARTSSDVSAQEMTPWPPSTTPRRPGVPATRSRSRSPRSKPGRCQSSQPSRPSKASATPLAPVGGRRERDQRVGVEVVDVRRREEAVQRRVDRGHGAAGPEARVVEQRDHLVLVLEPAVDALHRAQPLEVDEREAGRGERAEVAARALDREHESTARR